MQDKLNKSESKYYNTACLMDQALIYLLNKKEYSFITVKEICEKAGVNRSTFYLHYTTIDDLLAECIEYIGKQITLKYVEGNVIDKNKINTCSVKDLILVTPQYLLPYLEFIKQNKVVYKVAYSQPHVLKTQEITKYLYDKLFEPILIRFNIPKQEREYIIAFYLTGISAVIMEWIKNDCKEEIDTIFKIISNCLKVVD